MSEAQEMGNGKANSLMGAAAVLFAVLVGCGDAPAKVSEKHPAATEKVAVQILDHDGIQQLIAGHQGKVVVVDCWSTSCPPCVEEFPKLVSLHKQYGPEKVACVSLSFDYEGVGMPEEVEPTVLAFLEKQGATFDNILNREESDVLYKKMQLASVPAIFVYDQNGQLVRKFEEAEGYNGAIPLVEELLKQAN